MTPPADKIEMLFFIQSKSTSITQPTTKMNFRKSTEEIYKGIRVKSECETRQLASRQDHAIYGSYDDYCKTYWGVVFDGHGNDRAIQKIRLANLDEIMKGKMPWIDIQKLLDQDVVDTHTKLHSGSTMVLTKIHVFEDEIRVVVTNIGDSSATVFINDEPVFTTQPHSEENGEEIVRLIREGRVDLSQVMVTKGQSFDVISSSKIRCKEGKYVVIRTQVGDFELAMTQSLGHCGGTGLRPTTTVLNCRRTDNIRVCMCSDGITDMLPVNGLDSHGTFTFMTSTATTLLNEAERRWKQVWMVYDNMNVMNLDKNRFPKNGYDDCSCTMLTVEPAPVAVSMVESLGSGVVSVDQQALDVLVGSVTASSTVSSVMPPTPPPEENFDDIYK